MAEKSYMVAVLLWNFISGIHGEISGEVVVFCLKLINLHLKVQDEYWPLCVFAKIYPQYYKLEKTLKHEQRIKSF